MIPDPGGVGAAATRQNRKPAVKVTVDWSGAGTNVEDITSHVGGVKVTRQVAGDLPDEVALVEGSSVAELTADLPVGDPANNAKHAAWWFSRHSPTSPLFGKERLSRPVTLDVGFEGLPLVRRFTGLSTGLPVSSSSRSASLRALDLRERLRTDVAVPGVAADFGTGSIVKPGLNAQWVVDYVLRRNGFGASPIRATSATDTTLVSASMHGSAAPDVGSLIRAGWYDVATATHEQCVFTDGRFGYALDGAAGAGVTPSAYNVAEYVFAQPVPLPPDLGKYLCAELWLKDVPANFTGTTPIMLLNMRNSIDPDIITLEIRHDGTQRVLRFAYSRGSSGAAFVDYPFTATTYVDVMVSRSADGHRLWVGQDGSRQQVPVTDGTLTVDTGLIDRVVVTAVGAVEGFNVFSGTFTGPDLELPDRSWGYVAQAELGSSTNELIAALPSDTRDSWGLLQEVALAEYAWVGFDETLNRPFFRTQAFWAAAAQQTVAATITADQNLLDFAYDDGVASIRNQISAPVKAVAVTGLRDVWSGYLYMRPQSTRTFFVEFDDPLIDLDTSIQGISGGFPTTGASRLKANRNKYGTGQDLTPYVTATVEFWTAGTAHIRVTNRAVFAAWVNDGNDGPGLILAGSSIVTDLNNTIAYDEDTDSSDPAQFGPRPLVLPENPWRQDVGVTEGIIGSLLARLAWPQTTPVGLRIVGNPLLTLGTRVRIQDPGGTELDDEFWITGLDDDISPDGGYTQGVAVRTAWTPAVWGTSKWDDGSVWGP